MAHHIVSAASSETGIAGALQHHVLFICHENDGRYNQLKELCEFLCAGNEDSAKRLIQTLNPSSVVDVGKVDFTKLSTAKGVKESKSKIKNGISKK